MDQAALLAQFGEFYMNASRPVLFAGAGVAVESGLPDWQNLLKNLAQGIRSKDPALYGAMTQRIDRGDLLQAADLFALSDLTPVERFDLIQLNLKGYDPDRIKSIFDLNYHFVATTNFDKSLLDAYARSAGAAPDDLYLSTPAFKSLPFKRNFFIARLHGALEAPDSIVLTSEGFRGLTSNPDYERALHHIFTQCNVIFVGFSFADPAINSVLETIQRDIGPLHAGRHIALLSDDASDSLLSSLRTKNIQVLQYPNDGTHRPLWDLLSAAPEYLETEGLSRTEPRTPPSLPLKKYLASCIARIRIQRELESLRATVVEGVVSEEVRAAGNDGKAIAVLVHSVHNELGLRQDQVRGIVVDALRSLEDEGLIRRSERTNGKYVWQGPADDPSLGRDLDTVVRGIEDRFVTREGGVPSQRMREAILAVFNDLLISRGWDLGASFAAGDIPEEIDCISIVRSSPHFEDEDLGPHCRSIGRCFNDLFTRPSPKEAQVLSILGRAAFALELLFASPRDAMFLEAAMPNAVYLDANVLLPALVPGHPLHEIYDQSIEKIIKLRASSDRRVEVCVCREFLNEIFSHKSIAEREVEQSGDNGAEYAIREARYKGSKNINVFLAAFANSWEAEAGGQLKDFMRRVAPYNTEKDLRRHIEGKGITVVDGRSFSGVGEIFPKILHFLEVAYGKDLEKGLKTSAVVSHDAVQLAVLKAESTQGRSALFVSADKRLRGELERSDFEDIRGQFMSHLGLAQLVDLLVGNEAESREVSSIYWSSAVSTETERMRAFLIDTALREYEVGMLEPMHRAVDIVTQEAINEIGDQKSGDARADKMRLTRVVEDYEDRFYRLMREEYEKRGERR